MNYGLSDVEYIDVVLGKNRGQLRRETRRIGAREVRENCLRKRCWCDHSFFTISDAICRFAGGRQCVRREAGLR